MALELRHARGETDDATWVWWPERRILWTGDLFIWVAPNAGNPQKVQRYAAEWADALREMAARGAELLSPGHGMPIVGADRIQQALTETAEWLESLREPDARADERGRHARGRAARGEAVPRTWPRARYLQPVYDEPDYIVRNSGASTVAGTTAPRAPQARARGRTGPRDPDPGRRHRGPGRAGARAGRGGSPGPGRAPDRQGRSRPSPSTARPMPPGPRSTSAAPRTPARS